MFLFVFIFVLGSFSEVSAVYVRRIRHISVCSYASITAIFRNLTWICYKQSSQIYLVTHTFH